MTEKFYYDNKIVRDFAIATIIWGIIGMTVGLLMAMQLFKPALNMGSPLKHVCSAMYLVKYISGAGS